MNKMISVQLQLRRFLHFCTTSCSPRASGDFTWKKTKVSTMDSGYSDSKKRRTDNPREESRNYSHPERDYDSNYRKTSSRDYEEGEYNRSSRDRGGGSDERRREHADIGREEHSSREPFHEFLPTEDRM